jgi:hypothetical protein
MSLDVVYVYVCTIVTSLVSVTVLILGIEAEGSVLTRV